MADYHYSKPHLLTGRIRVVTDSEAVFWVEPDEFESFRAEREARGDRFFPRMDPECEAKGPYR